MKSLTPAGLACGFLAGTTFGSGLSFLFEWRENKLILSVGLLGLGGTMLGYVAASYIRRRNYR